MTTSFTFTLSAAAIARGSAPVTLTPYQSECYPGWAPSWLWNRVWGNRWLSTFAANKDLLMQLTIDSINCRFPTYAPADSLPLIGYDRNLTRGYDETDADYRTRLATVWTFWKYAGTHLGILIAMQPSGFTSIPWDATETEFDPHDPAVSRVFVVRNCDTDDAMPDGNLLFWNRFWVCIDKSDESIVYDGIWSDPGTYDDGGVWDLETIHGEPLTASMVSMWKTAIRQIKDASWTCDSIQIGEFPSTYPIGSPLGTVSIAVGE